MAAGIFSASEIESLAHPAVLESGRSLLNAGTSLKRIEIVGADIIARFKGAQDCTAVISRKPGSPLQSACTCGFGYGGACEHVAAAMLAANTELAIQTGLDLQPAHNGRKVPAAPNGIEGPSAIATGNGSDPFGDIESVRDTPLPRLYLSASDDTLLVELRFAYLSGTIEVLSRDRSREKLVSTPSGTVIRLERAMARELHWASQLGQSDLVPYRSGIFTPDHDAPEWVRSNLPQLAASGFEVFGRETIVSGPSNNASPSLKLSVTPAGKGFIECTIEASLGNTALHLTSLFAAVIAGKKFVQLSDGSTGEIPQEWIDKLAAVLALCEKSPHDNRIVLREINAQALKTLESIAQCATWEATCAAGLKRLMNHEHSSAPAIPASFKGTLRSYQRTGIEWFAFLKEFGLGGCLADDMGLGKTVQTLCMLLEEKERDPALKTSLLVVPTSLLFNWQREARAFAPSLLVMNFHGPDRKRYCRDDMRLADVILTTYGTVQREIDHLAAMRFNYIILDEAQMIKNPLSQTAKTVRRLSSCHRLALSGTPIENNLSELWSLFAFLNPGMLGPYSRFAATYIRPIEKERSESRVAVLRDLTRPCILRRTKAQVAKELPPKTEMIVKVALLPRQRTLYEMTRDACRLSIMQAIDARGLEQSRLHVLQALTRLRQICCHPRIIDPSFKGDSGKFEALDELIENVVAENHKALVFSPFVSALKLVRERLRERAIRHELLTGATTDRQKPVDAFQNEAGIPLMLISLKAGGVGLNLTAADYVILLDPWWNPAVETQAADRAYRIGQTRPVFVYKLIAQDSVEERVLELQKAKKQLVDAIISPDQGIIKSLGKDEIKRIFE
jgi:non-specific serine/threonine protein kinase